MGQTLEQEVNELRSRIAALVSADAPKQDTDVGRTKKKSRRNKKRLANQRNRPASAAPPAAPPAGAPKNATKNQEILSLQALVADLEARLKAAHAASASARDVSDDVLDVLSKENDGAPGKLSIAKLTDRLGITKSAAHHAITKLDKAGLVWVRKTHDPESGRPCHVVYHHKVSAL